MRIARDRHIFVVLGLDSSPFDSFTAAGSVSLTGEGVSVIGEGPIQFCGGPFMVGEGMAYQVKAGDWRITVASEIRRPEKAKLAATFECT